MKSFLFIALTLASFQAFSSEDCGERFTCEFTSSGNYILRENRIIIDHSKPQCSTVTLEVYEDEFSCNLVASDRNASAKADENK